LATLKRDSYGSNGVCGIALKVETGKSVNKRGGTGRRSAAAPALDVGARGDARGAGAVDARRRRSAALFQTQALRLERLDALEALVTQHHFDEEPARAKKKYFQYLQRSSNVVG